MVLPLHLLVEPVVLKPESVTISYPLKLVSDDGGEERTRSVWCRFQQTSHPNVDISQTVSVQDSQIREKLQSRMIVFIFFFALFDQFRIEEDSCRGTGQIPQTLFVADYDSTFQVGRML